jgi:3-hydroxyacyl-CoA dehydrogenase
MALNEAVRRIAVVGKGVIGASWSAQYLARSFDVVPKTGSGKILKRALRERFWAHQARAVS